MANYAYYPGCSLHATARDFDLSTKAVAQKLNMRLIDIPDWNCCGASSAHNRGHFLAAAIPGRNLFLAQKVAGDIVVPCAACYQRLQTARHELQHSEKAREKMEEIMGYSYDPTIKVKNIIEAVSENIEKGQLVRNLAGLKVVCYYGCLLVKPPGITGYDHPENPMSMDNILASIGAQVLPYPYKTECCGGSLPFYQEGVHEKLIYDILRIAWDAGAEAIVTACPLCMSNLDMRQKESKKYGDLPDIPVFYLTELVGLALGCKSDELGLEKHFIDPLPLLQRYNLLA